MSVRCYCGSLNRRSSVGGVPALRSLGSIINEDSISNMETCSPREEGHQIAPLASMVQRYLGSQQPADVIQLYRLCTG